jgi:hypothetical protein
MINSFNIPLSSIVHDGNISKIIDQYNRIYHFRLYLDLLERDEIKKKS